MVYFLSESRIDADSADFADFLFVFVDGRWSDSNCLDTDSWEEHRVGTRPTPTEFVIDMGLLWKTEDDTYFENPEIINTFVRLPMEWRIRPSQKSERHFGGEQRELFR